MAATAEGARLTELHRVLQVRLSTQAMAATRLLWSQLDPTDLAAARGTWLRQQLQLMKIYDGKTATAAAAYLEKFRVAEGHPGGPVVGVDGFDPGWAESSLGFNGPHRIAEAVEGGAEPGVAKAQALSLVMNAAQRLAMAGGRRVMDESSLANPDSAGWRRVPDGNPCAFCAMLVTRGVYRTARAAGQGRAWHRGCGCGCEEVFGEWTPTDREQRYIDAYDAAAERLDKLGLPHTQQNILPLMRERGKFNDSPAPSKPVPVAKGQIELPKGRQARPVPADVLDFNTRELRAASVDDLEGALGRAYETDHPNTDRIVAELDRREQAPIQAAKQKEIRAEAARTRRAAAKEADWAEVQRRINAGTDPYEAVEDVMGVPIDKQRRIDLRQQLNAEGVPGRTLEDQVRHRFKQETARSYVDAEDATRGHMLTREGEARGLDPAKLFVGPEARARRWASDELKEYWDQHGRLTLDDYRQQLLTGGLGSGRRVDDFLT